MSVDRRGEDWDDCASDTECGVEFVTQDHHDNQEPPEVMPSITFAFLLKISTP